MLYYVMLYYVILYCIVLYYIILYCIVLCYNITMAQYTNYSVYPCNTQHSQLAWLTTAITMCA